MTFIQTGSAWTRNQKIGIFAAVVIVIFIIAIVLIVVLWPSSITVTPPVVSPSTPPATNPYSNLPLQTTATPWTCMPEITTTSGNNIPVQVNTQGDVQCMSTDGQNCLWAQNCQNTISTNANTTLKPIVCQPSQYNQLGHWCYTANGSYKAQLLTPSSPGYTNPNSGLTVQSIPTPWTCISSVLSNGGSVPLQVNTQGDIQCMSNNGTSCFWSNNCQNTLTTNENSNLNPLICQPSQYTQTGHWCNLANTYYKENL